MPTKPMEIDEIANWFGVSTSTVRRWVKSGMPCLRPSPNVLRFDLDACTTWMSKQNQKAAV